jgi:hypothetical protein
MAKKARGKGESGTKGAEGSAKKVKKFLKRVLTKGKVWSIMIP